jgi:hypothetical protein
MSESILVLLNRIAASASIDEAWDSATAYFASLGFRRANYGFTRFKHLKTIGDPDDALFLTTCDADYVKRYFQGGFYAKTPVFRWAEHNSGACTWGWVKEAYEAGRLLPRRRKRCGRTRRRGSWPACRSASPRFPRGRRARWG